MVVLYVKDTGVFVVIQRGSERKLKLGFLVNSGPHFLNLNARTILERHEDKNSGLPQSVTPYSCSKLISEVKNLS